MARMFLFLATAVAVVNSLSAASAESAVFRRSLEEEDNEQDASSGYRLQNGPCFRSKIAEDNEDDDGNSYFYNGAYRAQYERYSSFFLCDNDGDADSDDSCDYSNSNGAYVMDMNEYLEIMTPFVRSYCGACLNQCSRRRLEDDEEEEEEEEDAYANIVADCSTCPDQCELLNSNNYEGADETNYLDCQEAYEEEDMVYYSAPACDKGEITIGLFYDEDCTIKKSAEFEQGFSYNTFRTIERIEADCSSGICNELFQNAMSCQDAEEDEDSYRLCKAAEKASRVYTYHSKPWYRKFHVSGIVILLLLVLGAFGFLSYTYYVRHRHHKTTPPMASLDHDLPPVT